MKFSSEARKSPVIGSFTPMTFHSTPNKEGVPLTKTMVDLQLHPNKQPDMAKKTIELTTDSSKQKASESLVKNEVSSSEIPTNEKPVSKSEDIKPKVDLVKDISIENKQVTSSNLVTPIVKTQILESPSNLKANEPVIKENVKNLNRDAEGKEIDITNNKTKVNIEPKPTNNNNAVPFGKWTEANRQEFLNKIKESKPSNANCTTNRIKQPNDLNRRDVLQKIDNARQSSNIPKRDFTTTNKSIMKKEPIGQTKSYPSCSTATKVETNCKTENNSSPMSEASTSTNTQSNNNRTEMFNQDLIDKTIEGILKDKSSSKCNQELRVNMPEEQKKEDSKLPSDKPSSSSEKSEQFVDSKTNLKIKEDPKKEEIKKNPAIEEIVPKKISNDIKHVNEKKDGDQSEEEVFECEPVTGDSQINKKYGNSVPPVGETVVIGDQLAKDCKRDNNYSNSIPIITENEFDKFARRNSVTLENQITLVMEKTEPKYHSYSLDNKSAFLTMHDMYGNTSQVCSMNMNINRISNEDMQDKHYASKFQIAYNSAITAKHQKQFPITVIEDQPVKVTYVDSTNEFIPYKLNVQGKQLSSKPDARDTESSTISSCDSVDSDFIENVEYPKYKDDVKIKTKHQRKQILSSVETPELELIESKDLEMDTNKKKRKTEECNKVKPFDRDQIFKKNSKPIAPKKSYLLGRNQQVEQKDRGFEDGSLKYHLTKTSDTSSLNRNTTDYSNKDIQSNAIDSLVKAAELIEQQPDVVKSLVTTQPNNTEPVQSPSPMKRGRGRPRKYPVDDRSSESRSPASLKKMKPSEDYSDATVNSDHSIAEGSDDEITKENWTMGKINDKILCPICNKLFRSEEVVYKHVQHCTKASQIANESNNLRKSSSIYTKFDRNKIDSYDVNKSNNKLNSEFKVGTVLEEKPPSKSVLDENVIATDNTSKKTQDLIQENKDVKKNPAKLQKPLPRTNNIVCEICGKQFRQLSYLVSHKMQHKTTESKIPIKHIQNETDNKSVYVCEICRKKFRKLHHLVQHRQIHNQDNLTRQRKSTEESQNRTVSVARPNKDNHDEKGAGFRCERCDKSFRKLHHLVEHRETHDGVDRTKVTTNVPKVDAEKDKMLAPTPQCNICKKSFRKLHHLSEHKETHCCEKKTLLAKDIIHECPLCYMVFPNVHSLEKHIIICKRKKRQSAAKRASALKSGEENIPTKASDNGENEDDDIPVVQLKNHNVETPAEVGDAVKPDELPLKRNSEEIIKTDNSQGIPAKVRRIDEKSDDTKTLIKQQISSDNKDNVKKEAVADKEETSDVKERPSEKTTESTPTGKNEKNEAHNKKKPAKISSATVTKTQPTNPTIPVITVDTSDEEDIRYMLNPNFEEVFKKVSANKRSSLQIERPKSKDLVKRRISLQHPPKIPRLRAKSIVVHPSTKVGEAPISSDESETKYSFPETVKVAKPESKKKSRPSTSGKPAKSPAPTKTGVAKRKSTGKTVTAKPQLPKKSKYL